MTHKQIKSKERVIDHGEVFTADREVKAMCDLVSQECDRIDSRFLEPACGDGNFLSEILRRKLRRVKQLYKNKSYDFERFSILALTSIYGVDLLSDNVQECRTRLFAQWNAEYNENCKKNCKEETRKAAQYILNKNILCGNALTMMQVDENQNDIDIPIIFPEWSLLMGVKLKRRDFRFDVLLKANTKPTKNNQCSLFEDNLFDYLSINPTTGEYMPKPIREYPAVSYKEIMKYD